MSNKEENRARREFLKEHHICVRCGKRDAFYNKTKCPECIEKEQKENREYYIRNKATILKKDKKEKMKPMQSGRQQGFASDAGRKRPLKEFFA